MAAVDTGELPEGLDDRLALLFVACDEALAPGAQMVLALPRGLRPEHRRDRDAPRHPGERRRRPADPGEEDARRRRGASSGCPTPTSATARLPVVLDCVAGHVHRRPPHRARAAATPWPTSAARRSRSPTRSWRCSPTDTEVRGLRAVVRLGLARRPGRVDDDGVALTLDEVDRSRWDQRAAARRARRRGVRRLRATAGSRSRPRSPACTASPRRSRRPTGHGSCELYTALEQVWPSPAVRVALLVGARPGAPCPRTATLGRRSRRELETLADRGAVVRPARRGLRAGRPVLAHRAGGEAAARATASWRGRRPARRSGGSARPRCGG